MHGVSVVKQRLLSCQLRSDTISAAMAIRKVRVSSLPEYLESVIRIRENWTSSDILAEPWFRGQADAGWHLVPGLYRADDPNEDEIRGEFQRRGIHLIEERPPSTEWEWYFLMQHHGAPTRLLDWSDGALTGLYFALRGARENQNAAVWVLDPTWLNELSVGLDSVVLADWEKAEPYLPPAYSFKRIAPKFPIAIDPPHLARRVAVQHSRFTIHGNEEDGLVALANQHEKSRLKQVIIASDSIDSLKKDIDLCGVTEGSLFPDLDGLSRELIADYGGTPREPPTSKRSRK
jgi:hypothetical protein